MAGNRRLRTEWVELAWRRSLYRSGDDGHTIRKTFVRKVQGRLRGGISQRFSCDGDRFIFKGKEGMKRPLQKATKEAGLSWVRPVSFIRKLS